MDDEQLHKLSFNLGIIPGSSWKYSDGTCIITILDEKDENNQEKRQWCRVLKIWITKEKIVYDTMSWSFIIGLVKSGILNQIK